MGWAFHSFGRGGGDSAVEGRSEWLLAGILGASGKVEGEGT